MHFLGLSRIAVTGSPRLTKVQACLLETGPTISRGNSYPWLLTAHQGGFLESNFLDPFVHPLMSNKGGPGQEGWSMLVFLTAHMVIPLVIPLALYLETE